MNPGYSHVLLVAVSRIAFNPCLEPLTGQFTDEETEAKRAHDLFKATEQARCPWDTSTHTGLQQSNRWLLEAHLARPRVR